MDTDSKIQKEANEKKCFIITPIGNANSDIFRMAKGEVRKYSVPRPIVYQGGMLAREIENIDKNKLQAMQMRDGNSAMRVHEMAMGLDTTSKLIIQIAENVGIDARVAQSLIKGEDVRRIIDYIDNFNR